MSGTTDGLSLEDDDTVPQTVVRNDMPRRPQSGGKMKANTLIYTGRSGAVYGLWIKNILLSILTLGIYRFWGKTNLRKYFASSTLLGRDNFEYHGTGKELFKGFLKVIPVYLIIVALYATLKEFSKSVADPILYASIFYIIHLATYSSMRYKVNRISLRGVRGIMTGSAKQYADMAFFGSLKKLFTLGILSPQVDIERFQYKIRHMGFGSVPFRFMGSAEKLKAVNIKTLLLAIPTLGFSRTWYSVALYREQMRGLILDNLRFKSNVTAGALLKHILVNLLILVCTLGLGMPIIMNRNIKFFTSNLIIGGNIDECKALQVKSIRKDTASESIDELLGIDGFMDGVIS